MVGKISGNLIGESAPVDGLTSRLLLFPRP
jgi:hypothetical protein